MKKKSIMISALGLVLCLSLVIGIAYRMPLAAHAVEVTATMNNMSSAGGGVSQPEDNKYVFEPGAQIQIVGWTGAWTDYNKPWENEEDTWWNSAVSTFNGRKWKTDPYMRWQNGKDLIHNFLAYWPASLAEPNSDLTNIPIEIKGDPEKDDILLAKWTNKRPDDNELELQFNHLMARFDVNLIFRDEYTNVGDISIETNLNNKGSCNLLTGKFSFTLGKGIPLTKNPNANGNYHWSGTCITVPHEFIGELLTLKFIGNGEEKTIDYEHTGQLNFESGKRTTLTLYVGKDKVELGGVTVTGWEQEDIIAGEAEEVMANYEFRMQNSEFIIHNSELKKKEDGQ